MGRLPRGAPVPLPIISNLLSVKAVQEQVEQAEILAFFFRANITSSIGSCQP